jgi:hypothetical protein
VRHYKHFYRWFLRYQTIERPSRAAVLRTLWNRAAEIDAEDAFCAFKAVFLARHPHADFRKDDYDAYRKGIVQLGRHDYPYAMMVKMLLKPLGLNAVVGRAVLPAIASALRFLTRHAARDSTGGTATSRL